jgi:ABC-2 type transport system ATP-binding protein
MAVRVKRTMPNVILRVQDLVKTFDTTTILHGITLDVLEGEIFGLIGSSGAGKTTFLNLLIGFLRPTSGQVLFRNPHLLDYSADDSGSFRSVVAYKKEVSTLFGFASQRPSVYPKLTLDENLSLFGSLYGLTQDAVIANSKILLKLMDLYDQRKMLAERLSGGMLKRLDIACALIHDPKVLILDEPTADLDPHLRGQMWELIRKINAKGTTILLSSHFLDELEELCTRVGILHKGRMENVGSPLELTNKLSVHEVVRLYLKKSKYKELLDKLSKQSVAIKHIDIQTDHVVFEVERAAPLMGVLGKLIHELDDEIVEIFVEKPSLTEVFEHVLDHQTGQPLDEIHLASPKRRKRRA